MTPKPRHPGRKTAPLALRLAPLTLLLCLCRLLPCAASAAEKYEPPVSADDIEQEIGRGDIEVAVKVSGISTAHDAYDIYAPFDGRVEDVIADLFDMVEPEHAIARIVSGEMAALLDSTRAEDRKQTEKRWKNVYDYFEIKPEFPGIVTTVHVAPRTMVFKGDRLFTVARKVVVVSRNLEPLNTPPSIGMTARLRHARNDSIKLDAALTNFVRMKNDPLYYRLWLEVSELMDGIKIGEQFDGTLMVGRSENTMLVPKNTLFELPAEEPEEQGAPRAAKTRTKAGSAPGAGPLPEEPEAPPTIKTGTKSGGASAAAGEKKAGGKTPPGKREPRPEPAPEPVKTVRKYLIMEVELGLVSGDQAEILKPGIHFINPEHFEIKRIKKEKPDGKTKKAR